MASNFAPILTTALHHSVYVSIVSFSSFKYRLLSTTQFTQDSLFSLNAVIEYLEFCACACVCTALCCTCNAQPGVQYQLHAIDVLSFDASPDHDASLAVSLHRCHCHSHCHLWQPNLQCSDRWSCSPKPRTGNYSRRDNSVMMEVQDCANASSNKMSRTVATNTKRCLPTEYDKKDKAVTQSHKFDQHIFLMNHSKPAIEATSPMVMNISPRLGR